MRNYANDVFVNVPFDDEFQPLFRAIVFAIVDCGFRVRCALEIDDASEARISKILRIIGESKFGIHDISRTELDSVTNLPRFNMPLELGMFLAAKQFGSANQKNKSCLILDRDRFRYQKFISDIAGQDIRSHGEDPQHLIKVVRNWLQSQSKRKSIPGGSTIYSRFTTFQTDLPSLCESLKLEPVDLTYADYINVVSIWLQANS